MIQTSADGAEWADLRSVGWPRGLHRDVGGLRRGPLRRSGNRSLRRHSGTADVGGRPALDAGADSASVASTARPLCDFTSTRTGPSSPRRQPALDLAGRDHLERRRLQRPDGHRFGELRRGEQPLPRRGQRRVRSRWTGTTGRRRRCRRRAYLYGAAYSESLDRFVAVGDGVIEYTTDSLPTVSLDDVSVTEDGGPAQFTVSLSGPSGHPVSVQYATASGTAVSPDDYAATSGTLTFAPGETVKTFDMSGGRGRGGGGIGGVHRRVERGDECVARGQRRARGRSSTRPPLPGSTPAARAGRRAQAGRRRSRSP